MNCKKEKDNHDHLRYKTWTTEMRQEILVIQEMRHDDKRNVTWAIREKTNPGSGNLDGSGAC